MSCLGAGGSAAADERADDAGAGADGADDAGAAADVDGADDAPVTGLGGAAAAADVGVSSGALQALVEITKPMIGIEPSIELRIETLRSGPSRRGGKGANVPRSYSNDAPHEGLDELVRKSLHPP